MSDKDLEDQLVKAALNSDYELVIVHEIIHPGKLSRIFRGHARKLDSQITQKVVLKTSRKQPQHSKEVAKLRQEYDIDSPHIIQYYDFLTILNERQEYKFAAILQEDFEGEDMSLFIMRNSPLNDYTLTTLSFLDIFVQLVEGLREMHQKGVIHKDVKPGNIMIDNQRRIKFIDFGCSTKLREESQKNTQKHSKLDGTLAYMSPEQTGRMSKSIDYRTDFYSLGVSLYEMSCGQLPFQSTEAMELIHCHVARQPVPPHIISPNTPLIISNIILKLMMKNAEHRYQSSQGILYDLYTSKNILLKNGAKKLEDKDMFKLGRRDFTERFQVARALYGRTQQLRTLLEVFDSIRSGSVECVFIGGMSGTGKSILVSELQRPVSMRGGLLITGKFNQSEANNAYSAITSAMSQLIRTILLEDEEKIEVWKHKIEGALGAQTRFIMEVIPELSKIIDRDNVEVANVFGSIDNKQHFTVAFTNLIKLFSTEQSPLVIFLDDLQWCDTASLNLIQSILLDPNAKYLMLIGSYRSDEMPETHQCSIAINRICKIMDRRAHKLMLEKLTILDVHKWIVDTLNPSMNAINFESSGTNFEEAPSAKRTLPLAEFIYNRSSGNPFYVRMLLESMYEQGVFTLERHDQDAPTSYSNRMERIRCKEEKEKQPNGTLNIRASFDSDSSGDSSDYSGGSGSDYSSGDSVNSASNSRWMWDMDKVIKMRAHDDIVHLMLERIDNLQVETAEILDVASCVGDTFDTNLLMTVMNGLGVNIDLKHLMDALIPAYTSGLIYSSGGECCFAHDRVRSTFYGRQNSKKRMLIHKLVATELFKRREENSTPTSDVHSVSSHSSDSSDFDDLLGSALHHINSSRVLLLEEGLSGDDAIRYAKLNVLASISSKQSIAYESAKEFIMSGAFFFNYAEKDALWSTKNHDFGIVLYSTLADVLTLNCDVEECWNVLTVLETRCRTDYERAKAQSLMLSYYVSFNDNEQAIKHGINALKLLQINIPDDIPSIKDCCTEVVLVIHNLLKDKSIDDITFNENKEIHLNESGQSILTMSIIGKVISAFISL
ncbi:hybrid signal transduction histidine kinase [Acrasis kona]|uniref:Hybrid signal transduction histidine kinase n=1 Tax=Acrasis kona TaxID=1008807 RepID=A0AAW2ZI64_9EUKA